MNEQAAAREADSFAARIADVQHEIAEGITRAGLQRDPYGHALQAMGSVIGTFPELVEYLEATRQPIRDEEMRRAVVQGISSHADGLVRALNIRNWLLAAATLVAALLIGGGVGYWLHGASPALVGVRAGAEKCDDRPDGSRLCWIPVWERMPPER